MAQYPYLEMYSPDNSGLSVEHWNDSWAVDMHAHEYCELMLINRGSCRHAFNGVETLLIPGDAVLIPSNEAHGYVNSGEISMYNCQFVPDRLDGAVVELLNADGLLRQSEQSSEAAFWEHQVADRQAMHELSLKGQYSVPEYELNTSKQGVIHLSPRTLAFIVSLMEHAMAVRLEQNGLLFKKYVEIIMLEVQKAQHSQNSKYTEYSAGSQRVIAAVLSDIENNLAEPFDIAEAARRYAFSPNYLRKLFKDFTGVTPIQYINRLRMVRACEALESRSMNIKEAAEHVGIYDLNYFSRLFKKIIGCSPNKI